ncbi:hypothetical protein K435DRAFT_335101 [Dendrothele bispora CBS 962.96]|uniref:Uncharacterized protein n=1 Tax=Dendrothele bispora (strain CBS 962.96) TaxID=1314807 RepID=A0A4S8LFL0_DENBC|nr:hypothetical protein K435DRAFT_335101 [Dendrothele bispora CBS 962.96]
MLLLAVRIGRNDHCGVFIISLMYRPLNFDPIYNTTCVIMAFLLGNGCNIDKIRVLFPGMAFTSPRE